MSVRPKAMRPRHKVALKWLFDNGGDAAFDRNGVALAKGETAPTMRATWNALRDAGLVELYGGRAQGGKGYGRLRLTDAGRERAVKLDLARKGYTPGLGGAKHRRPLMQDDDPEEFFA